MNDQRGAEITGAGLECGAALVRAEAEDLDVVLRALGDKLSDVPGLKVRVSYRQGRVRSLIGDLPYLNGVRRSRGCVRRIDVGMDGFSYWLESGSHAIRSGRVVAGRDRGAVEEELTVREWIASLLDEIARHNLAGYEAMTALRNLVELGRID